MGWTEGAHVALIGTFLWNIRMLVSLLLFQMLQSSSAVVPDMCKMYFQDWVHVCVRL